MLINKWLIIDSIQTSIQENWQVGYCLSVDSALRDLSGLYKYLQQLPHDSFSILLYADDSNAVELSAAALERIVGLFFQPCYYFVNDEPVVFVRGNNTALSGVCNKLNEKSKKQGLDVSILEVKNDHPDGSASQFVYQLHAADVPYDCLLNNWLTNCLDKNFAAEIHLLLSEKEHHVWNLIADIAKREEAIYNTLEYKLARLIYEKQKCIDTYKRQVSLKVAAEKDSLFHMIIQKEQARENAQWYYNEYEILPGWYKKLGHVLKVMMGKRSFRSLFDDKVKKYKD